MEQFRDIVICISCCMSIIGWSFVIIRPLIPKRETPEQMQQKLKVLLEMKKELGMIQEMEDDE